MISPTFVHLYLIYLFFLTLNHVFCLSPFGHCDLNHMPLTGGKPRLAGFSQSPHMLRGGTKRAADAIPLARILLCKGAGFACFGVADCFLPRARSGLLLMRATYIYTTPPHPAPARRSSAVVPDSFQQRNSVHFLFAF